MELREYQKEAVDFLVRRHKAVLADEQGLGKTATALLSSLKLAGDKPQILVVAPRIAAGTWKREAERWLGARSLVYSGKYDKYQRNKIWAQYLEERPELLIITYPMIKEILERRRNWQVVIADEYHNAGLINHKSATFKNFAKLESNFKFLLTGTPVKRGPHDLFGPLHLLSPARFSSFWSFVRQYCITTHDGFGYTIEPRPKHPQAFKELIQPFVIRRTARDVLTELPPLQRQSIYTEPTEVQRRCYLQMLKHGYIELPSGGVIAAPNEAAKLVRLRQILVSPLTIGIPDEPGGALESLKELVPEDAPYAVCTPFRAAVDVIADHLPTDRVYKIHGGMKSDPREVADTFQRDRVPNRALVFTIASGMSYDAFAADKIFFVGAEWSAIQNKQAETRLHRMGQTKHVQAYYMLYPDTIDDQILERLDENTMAAGWVLNTDYMLRVLEEHKRRF